MLVAIEPSGEPELPPHIHWSHVRGVLLWALQKGGRFRVDTSGESRTETMVYTRIEATQAVYAVTLDLRHDEEILESHFSQATDLLEAVQAAALGFALPGYDSRPDNLELLGKKPPSVEPPDVSNISEEMRLALKEAAESEDPEAWARVLELLGDPPEKEAYYGEIFCPEISLSLWLSHLGLGKESVSVLRRALRTYFDEHEVFLFALGEEQRRQGEYSAAGFAYAYYRKMAREGVFLDRPLQGPNDPYLNLFHWATYRLWEVGRWQIVLNDLQDYEPKFR